MIVETTARQSWRGFFETPCICNRFQFASMYTTLSIS